MPTRKRSDVPDLQTLLEALQANKGPDITKLIVGGVCTLVGAIILALVFWVGSSVSSLTTSVTKIGANVDQLQVSIKDLQSTQTSATSTMADLKAGLGKLEGRLDGTDADIGRMKERLRILEGQTPLTDKDRPR